MAAGGKAAGNEEISIHALRVEGDCKSGVLLLRQSHISIHALRVEGDRGLRGQLWAGDDFYPRPPGGGRQSRDALIQVEIRFLSTPSGWRATQLWYKRVQIDCHFYPRPPGGGRPPKAVSTP